MVLTTRYTFATRPTNSVSASRAIAPRASRAAPDSRPAVRQPLETVLWTRTVRGTRGLTHRGSSCRDHNWIRNMAPGVRADHHAGYYMCTLLGRHIERHRRS